MYLQTISLREVFCKTNNLSHRACQEKN